mmetsp:Transcript_13285/g.36702  ORF Transcript_13285/g.36702 Transcript_13285/m.36702 type:complete len:135 (-) Transcript_13285:205-609(-)
MAWILSYSITLVHHSQRYGDHEVMDGLLVRVGDQSWREYSPTAIVGDSGLSTFDSLACLVRTCLHIATKLDTNNKKQQQSFLGGLQATREREMQSKQTDHRSLLCISVSCLAQSFREVASAFYSTSTQQHTRRC